MTALPLLIATALAGAETHAQFAQRLETELVKGTDLITARLDTQALMDRTLQGVNAPPAFRRGFEKGMTGAIGGIGKAVVGAIQQGARFGLMGVVDGPEGKRARYRLILPDGGVNYHEYLLSPEGKGDIRVVDIYIYANGETLSDGIRRFAVMALAETDRSLMDRLRGKEQVLLKSLARVKAVNAAYQAQQWQQVVTGLSALPPSLQQEKMFLRMRADAARNLGDDRGLLEAFEQLRKHYPNDPLTELMMIDAYTTQKRYPQALGAIDKLDARVGGDAYLSFLRGGTYLDWGKRPEAREELRAAIQKEPTLVDPYWTLIGMSLEDGQFDQTAQYLSAVERDAGQALQDLREVQGYEGFLKSREGKKWMRSRVATAKPLR